MPERLSEPASSDDFTPYGFLRNPFHRASSWTATEGGSLHTSTSTVGVQWSYPTYRSPSVEVGLGLIAYVAGRRCVSRADFAAIGYASRYHTANVLGFDWRQDGVAIVARFFLVGDSLALVLDAHNDAPLSVETHLGLLLHGRFDAPADVRLASDTLAVRSTGSTTAPAAHVAIVEPRTLRWQPASSDGNDGADALGVTSVDLALAVGERRTLIVALGRHGDSAVAERQARAAVRQAPARLAALVEDDARFAARCPTLSGDWPRGFAEGLLYDMQTTRLLVLPAGGIFQDVWPAWMVAWPRVVLAEGVLDMERLGYADPALAQRAILSLFRDAPAPNVPCVFEDGGFNMVARDGSRCGTSPAWCLPFLHLERLYLRTLDRGWLEALFPYLTAYLDWWLDHRRHRDGWLVYKCTWEAGEDGNPRLDPSESGDADIADRVAPVELQATMAHAADVVAFFAEELGRDADAERWRVVRDLFRRRTRELFDPGLGRFRDWLLADQRFSEPLAEQPYWGVDSVRFSPLALTPLLGGTATPEQVAALRTELPLHITPPWTLWPSWCSTVLDCAGAAGLSELAGEAAARIAERVYRWVDRRTLAEGARPMPGASPEFWPLDWRGYAAADAYGWGATTANLLIHHVLGLHESRHTASWELELVPGLPSAWRQPGHRYTVRHVAYRGRVFDLTYVVEADAVRGELELDRPAACTLRSPESGEILYESTAPAQRHRFPVRVAQRHTLALG